VWLQYQRRVAMRFGAHVGEIAGAFGFSKRGGQCERLVQNARAAVRYTPDRGP
jgi:hypothetical protein